MVSGVFFSLICPLFGTIICNGMWLAPLPAVLAARTKGELEELNPVPWVAAYLNCIAYTIYGILRRDYYLFFSNVTGLCLATFYALTSLALLGKCTAKKDVDRLNIIIGALVFGLFFYSVMGFAACMSYNTSSNGLNVSATVFGLTGCCFSIMYYMAPLSTALEVIATKDASSFYAPMIILNFCNALLWLFYGFFAIGQPAVWAPNMVGCALSIFQLTLIVLYRRGSPTKAHKALDDSSNRQTNAEVVKLTKTVNSAHGETGSPMWKDGAGEV